MGGTEMALEGFLEGESDNGRRDIRIVALAIQIESVDLGLRNRGHQLAARAVGEADARGSVPKVERSWFSHIQRAVQVRYVALDQMSEIVGRSRHGENRRLTA